ISAAPPVTASGRRTMRAKRTGTRELNGRSKDRLPLKRCSRIWPLQGGLGPEGGSRSAGYIRLASGATRCAAREKRVRCQAIGRNGATVVADQDRNPTRIAILTSWARLEAPLFTITKA